MSEENEKTSGLVLYTRDASPPSCAVRMLGVILDLKFECREPSLIDLEHRTPEFKEMNPMCTIPVLIDGDFVVSESHAIMKYLLKQYGGEDDEGTPPYELLYPSDPKRRAIIDQCMYFDAGVFFVALKNIAEPVFLHGSTGATPKDIEQMEKAFEVLEVYLKNSTFLTGEMPSLADLSVGSTAAAAHYMFDFDHEKFPRCSKYLNNLQDIPYFKEIAFTGGKLLADTINTIANKNKEGD